MSAGFAARIALSVSGIEHTHTHIEHTHTHLSQALRASTLVRRPPSAVHRPPFDAMAEERISKMLSSVGKADARLVSVVDEVLASLEKSGLAYRLRIPPKLVGVHPANRNGYGVSAIEVHALGAEIVKMGWSPVVTRHAVCVEDTDSTIANFTSKLQSSTIGLGKVDAGTIKYGSLSCSHTNQFLVAVLCEVETTHASLAVDGRMSAGKLGVDEKLADALTGGLEWLVLSSVVPTLYPSLVDLVQCAKNATGAVQRKENEIQVLLKIQSLASVSSASSGSQGVVDWNSIASEIEQRIVIDSSDLKTYMRFVQLFGDGPFLSDLDTYHKTYVPTGRVVPVSTFASIVDLKLSPSEIAPHMAIALIKAQASCPEAKVTNKICRFITSGDIAALAGPKKKLFLAAEALLRDARSMVKAFKVPSQISAKALARLDSFAARFVCGKDCNFRSLDALGNNFVTEINRGMAEAGQGAPAIVSPWASGRSEPVAQSDIVPNMIRYDSEGQPIASSKVCLLNAGVRSFVCGRLSGRGGGARRCFGVGRGGGDEGMGSRLRGRPGGGYVCGRTCRVCRKPSLRISEAKFGTLCACPGQFGASASGV